MDSQTKGWFVVNCTFLVFSYAISLLLGISVIDMYLVLLLSFLVFLQFGQNAALNAIATAIAKALEDEA